MRYSRYREDGSDSNEWSSTIDLLTSLIADPEQPTVEKNRAVEILRWCDAKVQAAGSQSAEDHQVTMMLADYDAHALWEWPDKFVIKAVKGPDGATREQFTVIENNIPTPQPVTQSAPVPMPAPIASFAPGDAAPKILDPVREAAVAGLSSHLAHHYSPTEVARRLDVIAAQCEELRRIRAQEI
jgi:hypothetical protein